MSCDNTCRWRDLHAGQIFGAKRCTGLDARGQIER
jgi:hypothetical protein